MEVIIVGAGIGGLTLALTLHRAGIPAHVFEAATELRPLGAGINMLPHASQELFALGLEGALTRVGVETKEAVFYNRFGQLIYREPLGLRAGHASPQFSLHRGDLQRVLLEACARRLGSDRIHMGWKCSRFSSERKWDHRPFRRSGGRRRASAATRRRGGRLRRAAFGHPQAVASA